MLPRSGFCKPAHDAVVALHSAFDFLFSAARFVKKCHNSDAVWSARWLVGWMAVQGGQCQGIGPHGEWIRVEILVMVISCW